VHHIRLTYLVAITATLLTLLSSLAGCGGAPHYDERLVQADSLMMPQPDSALTVLQAIDADSLTTDADHAYHALLTTQAMYRCYVTATSDSAINCALDYYRHHQGEREKLTRALIYKGAVMEELGDPEEAMRFYKQAETQAAQDDYFNLGYTKLRIATLFIQNFSTDSTTVIRLTDASKIFEALNDTNYTIITLGTLGTMYCHINQDSAIYYLMRTIRLAQSFDPTLQYDYISKLSGINYYNGNYQESKKLALYIINNGKAYCGENQYYYYASYSYLKLHQLDSARYILSITPPPSCAIDSMNNFKLRAEIAKANNDYKTYSLNINQYHSFTEKIRFTQSKDIKKTETIIEKNVAENKNQILSKHNDFLKYAITIVVLLFFIGIYGYKRMLNSLNKYQAEYKNVKDELESAMSELKSQQQKIENMEGRNQDISKLVNYRLSAFNDLYQSMRVKTTEQDKVKKIIPFSSFIKLLNDRKQIIEFKPSNSFWDKMRISIDGEYNGIVTFVEKNYPNLSQDDLKLFCLCCSKISPQIIKLCLNFTNAKTVSNYKRRLLKVKMGLDMTMDDFIEHYLKGELN